MGRNEFICDCHAVNHEVVEQTLARMPEGTVLDRVAEFWKVMGDPTRCRMIFALQQHEMCVCDLANVLSMTKSSISHQLSKMRTSGVVKCRRSGKSVYYSLDDEHVSEIFSMTLAHIEHRKQGADHEE